MRILVVEDEHRIAAAIKKGLEQEKYAVDCAYDGDSGLNLAESEDYDLIILDLMLPGTDGMEICRKLRGGGVHIPILMLTARGQVADRVAGLDAGADDYLVKPFSFEELLARIRAISRRPAAQTGMKLKAGDLSLDLKTYAVSRGNKEIQLSAKEYALLDYLLRHPNRILTKEQIIAHVWNYDAEILPNTVEVYIKKLRNKIDEPFPGKTKLIETVRGFGYRVGGGNV